MDLTVYQIARSGNDVPRRIEASRMADSPVK
jgi:hypothetical protein